jgi:hypothetical protein
MLRGVTALAAATGIFAAIALLPGLTPIASADAPNELPQAPTGQSTVCTPNGGGGETCAGTYGGDRALDPNAINQDPTQPSGQLPDPPSVTIDQSTNLTYQMVHLNWSNFTPSYNYDFAPGYTQGNTEYALSIFECKSSDPHIDAVNINGAATTGDCYTIGVQTFATAGPPNTVTTVTGANGTGSVDFQVETGEQNTFLGCSNTVQCSIVVVPNWGGQQDTNDGSLVTPADCETEHVYDDRNDDSWGMDSQIGKPCSWWDRIVLPLSFAPTAAQSCPAVSSQFNAEGGTAVEQAMNQWRPGWCKQSPGVQAVTFGYNSGVDEYHARSDFLAGGQALTASTDVALVNQPASADAQAGSSRQYTYAPLAVSGVTIAYYVDDPQTGLPIKNLRLNARLMAKLLTESYSLQYSQCSGAGTDQQQYCDPAVAGNPPDLFDDPEFQALNEGPNNPNGYTAADFPTFNGANAVPSFLPTVLAGNSDLTQELTAWVWSDPDARAFLQGRADQWGMRVNSYYKDISYPISQFLPQDPGWSGVPDGSPVGSAPYESMQLAWNPIDGLDTVVSTLANNRSSALTNIGVTCSVLGWTGGPCVGGNWVYPKFPTQQLGERSLFAVVDQGDAAAFRFPAAQLVNAGGAAVAPTTQSMSAAVDDMQTNPDKITQYSDFANKDPNAYPLTQVEYAMVPTCNMDSGTAQAIAGFLHDASAGSSQLYGTNLGQLPGFGGYLALSDAQLAQDATAAAAVSAQTCTSPPPDTTVGSQTQSTVNGSTGGLGGGGGNSGGSPSTGANPSAGNTPNNRTNPSGSGNSSPVGLKSLDVNGFGGWALPAALIAGATLALAAGATYLLTGTAAGRDLLRRMRRKPNTPSTGDVE